MLSLDELEHALAGVLQADRHRLRQRLRNLRKTIDSGRVAAKFVDGLARDIAASAARREERATSIPAIAYDGDLPVVARREEIAAAIRDHQVVVVCGETGSGKSTQLPKICLEIGRGVSGLIGHTQPRRIAARSVAARLADELKTPLGSAVGFKIRFTDQTSENSLIKVMTDGVLLAETQHDRFLDQYDTLIIDEAHERSLNIDFLLGYIHRLLPKRPDLRAIITSATIDAARFAAHFGRARLLPSQEARTDHDRDADSSRMARQEPRPPSDDAEIIPAPIIQVEGRTYPVEVLYRPPPEDEATGEVDVLRGMVDAVEEICALGQGDILVFLPTERDILEAHQKLRGWEKNRSSGAIEIVPLYARLSTAEQNRVFQPHRGRRIVLATNVAESSLTVPGIHFVIDTGTARVSRYSPRSQVQRLPIEAISRASADQRKGRCGRLGPGVCMRLYTEEDYNTRDAFTSPEIQRTNLASVILQTLALNLGPIDEFPFLDPPRLEAIRDGRRTLFEIGAIDDEQKLTPLGNKLARLPVDPRIGRMLLAAADEHALADVLIIAAALETQDPRLRPPDKQQQADAAHAAFADPDSDFVSYLRLWDFHHRLREDLSRSQLRRAMQQNFLSELRLREWHDVHRQLLEMVGSLGLKAGRRRLGPFDRRAENALIEAKAKDRGDDSEPNSPHALEAYAAVHRSLLAGLLSNIAHLGEANEYIGGGNQKFFLWPGSGVFARRPKWIVAAELVETTKRYARTAARIDPDWLEPLAEHLVKRSYSDPHWDPRSGSAMAHEKVSLFGLTIVPKRRVRYTTIDPVVSRELLVRHGLAAGELATRGEFLTKNKQLLADIAALSAKTRRRDLIVDEDRIFAFYQVRVPADVADVQQFERWRVEAEKANRKLLWLTQEDVVAIDEPVAKAEDFPDELQFGRTRLNLQYRFEPGTEADGVTVTIPAAALGQLSADRLDWLVPGLVVDKLEALARSLPKSLRTKLGPAPDAAKQAASELRQGEGSFLAAAADVFSQLAGETIPLEAFDVARLPPHLAVNVRVVDEKGKTLKQSRDIDELREHFDVQPVPSTPLAPTPWHRDGVTAWDFGDLPASVEIPARPFAIVKHVAIVDAGETAGLRLVDAADEAARRSRAGVRRLLAIAEKRELKAQVEWLPNYNKLAILVAPLSRERLLLEQLCDLLADRSWRALDYRPPRTRDDFERLRKEIRREITPAAQQAGKLLTPLGEAYHAARLALDEKRPANWQESLDDAGQQLGELTPPNFFAETPAQWLEQYPRYLRGIAQRLAKIASKGLLWDRQQMAIIAPAAERLRQRLEQHRRHGHFDPELSLYRWMLEELRVSLFAQELGTSLPISPQRLEKQWSKVRK